MKSFFIISCCLDRVWHSRCHLFRHGACFRSWSWLLYISTVVGFYTSCLFDVCKGPRSTSVSYCKITILRVQHFHIICILSKLVQTWLFLVLKHLSIKIILPTRVSVVWFIFRKSKVFFTYKPPCCIFERIIICI